MKNTNHLIFRMLLIVFALFAFSATANAQEGFWCGQILPPPDPGAPPQPCCDCEEQNCKASPNFISVGNYVHSETDLSLPTRGFPLTVHRSYDSVRMMMGHSVWVGHLPLQEA